MKTKRPNLQSNIIKEFLNTINENTMHTQAIEAFDNTSQVHITKSLAQRNPGPESAGSTFLSKMTEDDLRNADWIPANDPDITSPALGFKAPIPGILGVLPLSELPATQTVRLQPAHKGQVLIKTGPETGKVAAECVGVIPNNVREVDFTTLIIGPHEGKTIVYTFFPGAAGKKFPDISMDQVKKRFNKEGDTVDITVAEAESLGFHFCKHVPAL